MARRYGDCMSLIDPSPETYDRILGLRVVRAYTDEPIPPSEMDAILEAARWTGSSKNVQGWEFILIDGDELENLATAGNFTDPVRNSVAAIAIVQTPTGNPFDVGRAAQNIMLAAASRGIGSCPITLHHDDRASAVLRLPAGYRCKYAVSLGYPFAEGEAKQREARRASGMGGRKPMTELTHHQHYGG
jgi:nitroreductase